MVEYTRVDVEMKYRAEWLAGDGAERERVGSALVGKSGGSKTSGTRRSGTKLVSRV